MTDGLSRVAQQTLMGMPREKEQRLIRPPEKRSKSHMPSAASAAAAPPPAKHLAFEVLVPAKCDDAACDLLAMAWLLLLRWPLLLLLLPPLPL